MIWTTYHSFIHKNVELISTQIAERIVVLVVEHHHHHVIIQRRRVITGMMMFTERKIAIRIAMIDTGHILISRQRASVISATASRTARRGISSISMHHRRIIVIIVIVQVKATRSVRVIIAIIVINISTVAVYMVKIVMIAVV